MEGLYFVLQCGSKGFIQHNLKFGVILKLFKIDGHICNQFETSSSSSFLSPTLNPYSLSHFQSSSRRFEVSTETYQMSSLLRFCEPSISTSNRSAILESFPSAAPTFFSPRSALLFAASNPRRAQACDRRTRWIISRGFDPVTRKHQAPIFRCSELSSNR